MEIYESFEKLKQKEQEGKDYRIRYRYGTSGILVMAPHGGGIEPGTTEIAYGVAGEEHSFYSFEGLKPHGNLNLHITSRRFDEPIGVNLSKNSEILLVIHGCQGGERAVYIGGRDRMLRERVENSLINANFSVQENPRFPGLHHRNICNRGRSRMGVQLEISMGLRGMMFHNISRIERKLTTKFFDEFLMALRQALSEYQESVWLLP